MAILELSQPAAICDSIKRAPLRAAASRADNTVHLVGAAETIPAQQALCGAPLTAHPPERLLVDSGCARCVDLALEGGATYAEDRHRVLVNLARFRRSAR